MNRGIQAKPPNTPEHHKTMARIFLEQARTTIHRDWKCTMLEWAGERRRLARDLTRVPATSGEQIELWGGRGS